MTVGQKRVKAQAASPHSLQWGQRESRCPKLGMGKLVFEFQSQWEHTHLDCGFSYLGQGHQHIRVPCLERHSRCQPVARFYGVMKNVPNAKTSVSSGGAVCGNQNQRTPVQRCCCMLFVPKSKSTPAAVYF